MDTKIIIPKETKAKKTTKKSAKKEAKKLYTCVICGKKYEYIWKQNTKRTCCAECEKIRQRNYNTQYVAKKRQNETVEERKARQEVARVKQAARTAQHRWDKKLACADTVMFLASQDNGRELLAAYFDKYFVVRGNQFKERTSETDEEIAASKMLDALGDQVAQPESC